MKLFSRGSRWRRREAFNHMLLTSHPGNFPPTARLNFSSAFKQRHFQLLKAELQAVYLTLLLSSSLETRSHSCSHTSTLSISNMIIIFYKTSPFLQKTLLLNIGKLLYQLKETSFLITYSTFSIRTL